VVFVNGEYWGRASDVRKWHVGTFEVEREDRRETGWFLVTSYRIYSDDDVRIVCPD
jgi:hypothetical protein